MIKILLFILILVLDQYTKHLAHTRLQEGIPNEVIPDFFNLTLVYNPGAAFGMFSGIPDPYRRIVLLSVSVIALAVVFKLLLKDAKEDVFSQYVLIAILSGAIGNIIDRFRYDRVVDFLDVYWKQYHWPAFNIADSAISVGVCLLLLKMATEKKEVVKQE